MRLRGFSLAIAVSIFGVPAEGATTLCAAPSSWPGGATSAEVVLTGVSAIAAGKRGDGPIELTPVSLNAEVLSLGEQISISGGGLVVQGPAVCVRYRPEWLGLTLANTGAKAVGGTLKINIESGVHLEAELPVLMPGEVRSLLVMSGEPISAIAADALELVPKHN